MNSVPSKSITVSSLCSSNGFFSVNFKVEGAAVCRWRSTGFRSSRFLLKRPYDRQGQMKICTWNSDASPSVFYFYLSFVFTIFVGVMAVRSSRSPLSNGGEGDFSSTLSTKRTTLASLVLLADRAQLRDTVVKDERRGCWRFRWELSVIARLRCEILGARNVLGNEGVGGRGGAEAGGSSSTSAFVLRFCLLVSMWGISLSLRDLGRASPLMEPTPFLRGIATVDFSSNAGQPGNKASWVRNFPKPCPSGGRGNCGPKSPVADRPEILDKHGWRSGSKLSLCVLFSATSNFCILSAVCRLGISTLLVRDNAAVFDDFPSSIPLAEMPPWIFSEFIRNTGTLFEWFVGGSWSPDPFWLKLCSFPFCPLECPIRVLSESFPSFL